MGGRLSRRLSEEHEVWASSRKPVEENILNLHGGIKRIDHAMLLQEATFPGSFDAVIHLAALNEIDCVKYPSEAIRVNIDETRIILENSIARKIDQFIYFSTAHVYGAPLVGSISEDTITRAVHPYSITHRAAEDYIVAATQQKKIQGTVIRLSNAFGAPVSPHVNRWTLLANDLCRQAVEKGKLTLRSNGCQYRDFICITDVEEVIAKMLTSPKPLSKIIYNLGSGISMRVIDMADMIIQTAVTVLQKNISLDLPADQIPSREPSLNYSVRRLLDEGYQIANDVNLELERLLQFCSENFARN